MKENDKSELLRETLLSTAIFFHNLFLFHLLYSRVQTCSLLEVVRKEFVSWVWTQHHVACLLLIPSFFQHREHKYDVGNPGPFRRGIMWGRFLPTSVFKLKYWRRR